MPRQKSWWNWPKEYCCFGRVLTEVCMKMFCVDVDVVGCCGLQRRHVRPSMSSCLQNERTCGDHYNDTQDRGKIGKFVRTSDHTALFCRDCSNGQRWLAGDPAIFTALSTGKLSPKGIANLITIIYVNKCHMFEKGSVYKSGKSIFANYIVVFIHGNFQNDILLFTKLCSCIFQMPYLKHIQ